MAERGEVPEDLPHPVVEVRDDTGKAGQLAVVQHDRAASGELPQVCVRKPAGGEDDPVDDRAQPVEMVRLQPGVAAGVAEHEGAVRGAGALLRAADQPEVVRVGDVGDEHGEHLRAPRDDRPRDPVRAVAQPAGDLLHAGARRRADPVRLGQRARHRRHGDAGLAGDVLQRRLQSAAPRSAAWERSRHRL